MSKKNELIKISEAYNEVVVNELKLGPGPESTAMAPSNNTPTVLKISDNKACEDCEDGWDAKAPTAGTGETDADMAKNELYKMHNASKQLYNLIKDGEDLEPWVFSKITVAASYIEGVRNYLEYNKFKKQGEFAPDGDAHEFKIVSRIRDMLHGESKEVLETVLRQTIFNLEAIKTIEENKEK
jgi:hypothetical protein